ncbi:hypothetical protein JMUB3936_0657 [Leptotrichia wadei]|jgi:hypothetical protein|uniref:Uncharacterized protein n=1 Tax=Leptotrichia wadei TaxID=157687 RepID=A0A510KW40_9FUSO|nr:hypothetical protein [Leptotrichia wadei]BBM54373.1 hypothetical protein JMUB3936_0657 [Leptotrichia wadei]
MEEKIKIYIRNKNKIYIFFNDEIYFFENQELEMALESFFEENNVEKNVKLAVILHYSYFLFDNFDGNVEETGKRENYIEDSGKKTVKLESISEILKKKINFVKRKMVINHLENQFLDIYLDKREIVRIKNCLKKYSAVISELKVDFEAVYNYYKDGNFEVSQNNDFENEKVSFENEENFQDVHENTEEIQKMEIFGNEDADETQEIEIIENTDGNRNFGEIEEIDVNEESLENENSKIEILQLGEENSLRILIEDEKIVEVEKIELKIEDVDDVENFDFGDMVVVGDEENDVKVIFAGEELSNSLDFIKRMAIFDKESVKNIKVLDVVIAGILIFAYFLIYNSIPLQKKTVENEVIQKEIKSLEKDYLKRKAEEIPDYSKELATLREIDGGIKRREYYSVIKFLVENSKNGIDYTKINYEKAKWIVQGEMENFNNFERLENNILRRYPNSELGYLKDNDTATVFEYVIEPFQN